MTYVKINNNFAADSPVGYFFSRSARERPGKPPARRYAMINSLFNLNICPDSQRKRILILMVVTFWALC